MINCQVCKKEIQRPEKWVKNNIKRGHVPGYCSRECQALSRTKRKEVVCDKCGKSFYKVPSQLTLLNFCSRKCSASYHNSKSPKRSKEGVCRVCGVSIRSSRSFCKEHKKGAYHTFYDWSTITYRELATYTGANKNVLIRQQAKRVFCPTVCEKCGYDLHVEVCHIKSISSFPMDTPVSLINSLDNLVGLCPNCHWELDKGVIRIEDFKTTKFRGSDPSD
jgi:5-methylcytosine-specific restriction endonuclease McrA